MSSLQDRVAEAWAYRRTLTPKHGRPTKVALAAAAGVTTPSVAEWFQGPTKMIKGNALLGAARYLKVSPEWLASGVGPMAADGPTSPPSGLSHLQMAALEAFGAALKSGKVTDAECVDVIKKWLG